MAGVGLQLTKASQTAILQLLQGTQSSLTTYSDRRLRMEKVDRKYAMEQAAAAKKNQKGKLDAVVTPTVLTHVETIVAQLTEIFLTGYPIFAPVAAPKYAAEMGMMKGSFIAQARQFAWSRNMILFFRDAAKYNVAALEVDWSSFKFSTINSDTDGTAKVKPQDIEGNKVARLDPYNIFYDKTLPAAEVHTEGSYAGYTQKMSRMRLHQYIDRLPQGNVVNKKEALASSMTGVVKYWRPVVSQDPDRQDTDDWGTFFGNVEQGAETEEAKGQSFYLTTLYARIIPAEYKINIPNPQQLTIFKFIFVNGCHVIYAEALTDSHQYLPMLISELTEDGLNDQTQSYGERIIPIQNLVSDLHTARVASLRRAIGDRALYDPSKISPKDVNSANPAAKIPVRNVAYGQPISNAYYQIPYRDEQAQYLLSEAAQVDRYGQQITGQNPTSQGNFIPGNKTQTEFSTIMSNANNRTIVLATMMENQTLVPLKTILLFNTLQYQQSELFVDIQQQQEVDYNPINVRQVNWDWEIADGLLPISKVASPQVYGQAMQTLMQVPALAQAYNLGPMFSYLMQLQGVDHLKQFEKSPEQLQQEQQQAMQLRIAEAGANQANANAAQGAAAQQQVTPQGGQGGQ